MQYQDCLQTACTKHVWTVKPLLLPLSTVNGQTYGETEKNNGTNSRRKKPNQEIFSYPPEVWTFTN